MQDLDDFASRLADHWGNKTLEELRVQAERENTGIAFDAVRAADGHRFLVVLCVTDIDQIARLAQALKLNDDGVVEDWNTLTLAEVSMRTARSRGLCFESLKDEYGRQSALVLIAADPEPIRILEAIFKMPK